MVGKWVKSRVEGRFEVMWTCSANERGIFYFAMWHDHKGNRKKKRDGLMMMAVLVLIGWRKEGGGEAVCNEVNILANLFRIKLNFTLSLKRIIILVCRLSCGCRCKRRNSSGGLFQFFIQILSSRLPPQFLRLLQLTPVSPSSVSEFAREVTCRKKKTKRRST